jgi:hypothetical protein
MGQWDSAGSGGGHLRRAGWSSGAPFPCDRDPMPELSPAAGQQPHDDRRAPADEGTCPVEEPQRRQAVRLVHVTGSLPQQAGIVLVEAKPAIAAAAQEAADVAALMVVIDAEPLGVLQLADLADAPLPREHPLVVLRRDPVDRLRPAFAGLCTCPLAVFTIRAVSQPLLRIERLAVPVAPGAIGCEHFFSKHRILGISLLSSFGGARRHRSLLLNCARWDRWAPRQACVGPPPARAGRAAREAGRGRIAVLSGSDGCAARPGAAWCAAGNASRRSPAGASRAGIDDQHAVVENIHL